MPIEIQEEWKMVFEKNEFYSFVMNARNEKLEAKFVFVLKNMCKKNDFYFPEQYFSLEALLGFSAKFYYYSSF